MDTDLYRNNIISFVIQVMIPRRGDLFGLSEWGLNATPCSALRATKGNLWQVGEWEATRPHGRDHSKAVINQGYRWPRRLDEPGHGFSLRSFAKVQLCWLLCFSPVMATLIFKILRLQRINSYYFMPSSLWWYVAKAVAVVIEHGLNTICAFGPWNRQRNDELWCTDL